jgi:uncharacterized membrane protein HdeD (DUF308 family)
MTAPPNNNNVNGAIAESDRDPKNAGFARNWWAIAIRAALASGFVIGIFFGPTYTFGTLVLVFAAYLVADGIAAIVAGLVKMQRDELWQTLIFEGLLNLFLACTVFVWPAMAAIVFVTLASIWAIVTGALLLAAARQMSGACAQVLLSLAGLVCKRCFDPTFCRAR